MSRFSDLLASRETKMQLVLPANTIDPHDRLSEELLSVPSSTSRIRGMSYTVAQSILSTVLDIELSYDEGQRTTPTFLVRDAFELTCAMSMGLRMHLPVVDIVVDNRSGFIPPDDSGENFFGFATKLQNSLGEDLECAQAHQTSQWQRRLCKNKVIVYRLSISYYEDPHLLNALSCVVAEHARTTMDRVGDDPIAVMDALMGWFRENVQYLDTDSIHDHSAVGLVVNGTSVCQGIAVYANQFLWHCGIPNRYVHGHGRIGRHGWNVAKVNGEWEHIDYTFALNDGRRHIISSSASSKEKFRECHTWDEDEYATWRNDWIANAKQSLGTSVISMIPNGDGYSVNGCIVDTTDSHPIMQVMDGEVWVGIGVLSQLLGGGWGLRDGGTKVSVCFNSMVHQLEAPSYRIVDDTIYMPAHMLPSLGIGVSFGSNDVIHIKRGSF